MSSFDPFDIASRMGRLEAQTERQIKDHERTHEVLERMDYKLDNLVGMPERMTKVEASAADYEAKKKAGKTIAGWIGALGLGGALTKLIVDLFNKGAS